MNDVNLRSHFQQLSRLLQLASPLLPVGGYSYSEGLETLILQGTISDRSSLQTWVESELQAGAIRIEAAVMNRAYLAASQGDLVRLKYWDRWLSALRETEELRHQSWQMGGSLTKLAILLQRGFANELTPEIQELFSALDSPCHYAIAFGITAQSWQIDRHATILAYLQCWATSQIGVGVKLIPLGQTAGQQMLWQLLPQLDLLAQAIPALTDDDLYACTWGSSLASMQHETLYSRLFRS